MFPINNMDAQRSSSWDEEEDNLRNNIDNFWAEDNAEHHQLFDYNLHDAHSFISNSNLHESSSSSNPNLHESLPSTSNPNLHESPASTSNPNLHESPASTSNPNLHQSPASTSNPNLHESPASTSNPNLYESPASTSNPNLHESPASTSTPTPVFTLQKDVAPLRLGLTRTPSPPPPPPPPPLPVLTGPINNVESQPETPKASNFCISAIKIGHWQRVSRREGDLIAKIYYSRKKLIWEVLDGMLKKKMEIPWSDITAITAVMQQNQPGILQIELEKPPSFLQEIPPRPKKHTNWDPTTDFTHGQALQHRKHIVMFPPGVLDKHYEQLIQYDKRLYELSRISFPSPFNLAPANFDGPGPGYEPAVAHVPPLAQHYVAHPTTPILSPVNGLNMFGGVRNYQVMGHAQSGILQFPRTDPYFLSLPLPPPPYNQYQGFPAANNYLLNNPAPLPPPPYNQYQGFPVANNYPLNSLAPR